MDLLDHDIAGSLAQELAPADFARIVEGFGQDMHRLTEEMAVAMASNDAAAVYCAAHGLAGAAASVGAVALERAARRGMVRGVVPQDLVSGVRTAGSEAMRELRALIRTSDAA